MNDFGPRRLCGRLWLGGRLQDPKKRTATTVKDSHAIYVSQPEAVAALVEQAAKSVKTSAAA